MVVWIQGDRFLIILVFIGGLTLFCSSHLGLPLQGPGKTEERGFAEKGTARE